ncbi:MAG: helix-hairpin-helix domain-containing protein, partial [Deltaproteobacteria bacterium]|nr:helix-hairpin-helix domain-containing protein [Deltaproteobacteria bacterium]
LAMNILSGIPAREFVKAVTQGNLSRLVAIPGVGKKMAERMIVELKDKMLKVDLKEMKSDHSPGIVGDNAMKDDALSALVNLGYKNATAKAVIEKVVSESGEGLGLDVLLKNALKTLSN